MDVDINSLFDGCGYNLTTFPPIRVRHLTILPPILPCHLTPLIHISHLPSSLLSHLCQLTSLPTTNKFHQDSNILSLGRQGTHVWLIVRQPLMKAGWWDAPLAWPHSAVFIVVSFEHILHTSGVSIVVFEEVNIHLLKVNNEDTRTMYQICSKLTKKKLGWRSWPPSGVFIVVNSEHIPHIVLEVLVLALKK